MGDERDTRVECLEPGDRFRWLGEWFTVRRLRQGTLSALPTVLGHTGQQVAIEVEEPEGRVYLFPVRHFIAADCPR